MIETVRERFRALNTQVDFCSLRYVEERGEQLCVRQNVEQPLSTWIDRGAMITVIHEGGYGYAATSDLSSNGIKAALEQAKAWALRTRRHSVFDFNQARLGHPQGRYQVDSPRLHWNRRDMLGLLHTESAAAKRDERIVDWSAALMMAEVEQLYLTNDGGEVMQRFNYVIPNVMVTAFADGEAQTRSLGGQGNGYCQQGGVEIIERSRMVGSGRRVADEALQLLASPNCPTGSMDLLLMPEQMMLQIHESIGHPLELDRILGDERNYAGTSFVTLDMFGQYQYGSTLLNVTYDPSRQDEFATFGWDDDGSAGEKTWLIRDGLLERPLGGAISQARAGMPGVANSRACSWNRPPIDRMANLNVEPGSSTLEGMIGSIERGVLMDTNVSWSIDDSRNKFQFSCEVGWLIENGEITGMVKNPGYRGISATFWRSLKQVGNESTFEVMGTPSCGKGEPNQAIRVGHASPACLFGDVEVFGGEI